MDGSVSIYSNNLDSIFSNIAMYKSACSIPNSSIM